MDVAGGFRYSAPAVEDTDIGGAQKAFAPTLWTAVLRAKDPTSPDRRDALGRLIEAYWKPVYFYLRRRGRLIEEAKDLTQGFFTQLLEHEFLRDVSQDRGRFRTFLLASLNNYVTNQAKRAGAQKRGGGQAVLSLNFDEADAQYVPQPAAEETPDRYFERQWALAIVGRALEVLSQELDPKIFAALKPHLAGGPSYEETAASLGVTKTHLNNLIHRTRKRYRGLVRAQVAASVADPELVDEEFNDLFKALKS